MNIRLITPFLALLIVLPAAAQTPSLVPVPTQLQRDAGMVLTPAFVRDADYIAFGPLRKEEKDPTIARLPLPMGGDNLIRGWRFMSGQGLVRPTNERDTPLPTEPQIVFGRYDPITDHVVMIGSIEATTENVAKVRALEAANRRLKVTFSSDKKEYSPGDSIILKWEVENTSTIPLKFYTGQYALLYKLVYDNASHSNGTGGSHTRKPENYIELAPGQKWSETLTLKGPYPEGEVRIEMTLNSGDNFIGSDPSGLAARQARKRVEGVLLFQETGNFSVQIKAPDAKEQAALAQKLSSLNWGEAYTAAQTLSQLDSGANLPEVKRLARHSWPAMRVLAVQALSKNATTFTPELRALLFDSNAAVRNETLEIIRRREIGGAGLSILALAAVNNEAIEKKISNNKLGFEVETTIGRTRDSNVDLGDLLEERIAKGQGTANGINAPYLLNYIAGNARNTRIELDKPATPEQTEQVLAAWKNLPAERTARIKPRTQADLDAEIKFARTSMYGDFKVGPKFEEIVVHLKNLYGKFFPRPDDVDRQWLESLDADSRVDVLRALDWQTGRTLDSLDNAPAWRVIAQIEGPAKNDAFRILLSRLYNAQTTTTRFHEYDKMRFFAPIALAKMDFERARPHLQTSLSAPSPYQQLGAAIGLLVGGDKSAVPLVFEPKRWEVLTWSDSEELDAALAKVTGLSFKNRAGWQKWWNETGKTQEWK